MRSHKADLDFALMGHFPADKKWEPLIRFSKGMWMLYFNTFADDLHPNRAHPAASIDTIAAIRAKIPVLPHFGNSLGLNAAWSLKQGFTLKTLQKLQQMGCLMEGCQRKAVYLERIGDAYGGESANII
jgi:hypothetical protein